MMKTGNMAIKFWETYSTSGRTVSSSKYAKIYAFSIVLTDPHERIG
jgi:hypothetical protein